MASENGGGTWNRPWRDDRDPDADDVTAAAYTRDNAEGVSVRGRASRNTEGPEDEDTTLSSHVNEDADEGDGQHQGESSE